MSEKTKIQQSAPVNAPAISNRLLDPPAIEAELPVTPAVLHFQPPAQEPGESLLSMPTQPESQPESQSLVLFTSNIRFLTYVNADNATVNKIV
jgi:hypothetical protein